MNKLIVIFSIASCLILGWSEEATKLQAGKPKVEAPTIAIPEVDALRLKTAQQGLVIDQYQMNEYWKMVQSLQEKVKREGEVIQNLSAKILADAKVDKKEYKISEDGLRLEKITSPVAQGGKE